VRGDSQNIFDIETLGRLSCLVFKFGPGFLLLNETLRTTDRLKEVGFLKELS